MLLGIRLLSIVGTILDLYSWVFVIDAVLSWFILPHNPIRRILIALTEPVVSLFRPLAERIMQGSMIRISFAHLFAFLFIQLLQRLVIYLVNFLYSMMF